MARELTWHERRAVNLQLQRRSGELQRSRPNPSTGTVDSGPMPLDGHTATPAPEPTAHDDFPQPLQGFDYSFGAVG